MYMSGEYDKDQIFEQPYSGLSQGPRIVGINPIIKKRCNCWSCGSIIEYLPKHVRDTNQTDEGTKIKGLNCPGCGDFIRTNS